MKTVECPDCHGLGFIVAGTRRDDDGEEYNINEDCPRCEGEGTLPEHDPQLLLERIKRLEEAFKKERGENAS